MYRSGGRGQAAILKSIAGTISIGGIASIPLYKTFMHIIRQATGDDWGEEELLGKIPAGANWLRDIIEYGFPSLAGVNIGGSVGMELPILDRLQVNDSWVKQLAAGSFDLIGIPGAILQDVERAVNQTRSGKPLRGLESVLPVGAANFLKGYRLYNEGAHSAAGRPIVLPGEQEPRKFGIPGMVGQMLGFQATDAAKGWSLHQKLSDFRAFKTGKQGAFADRMAKAIKDRDRKKIKVIGREIADWNKSQARAGRFEYIIDIKQSLSSRLKTRQPPKYLMRRAMELKGKSFGEK